MPQKQGGKSKKGKQTAKNKSTGKYIKQKARTTANKKKAHNVYLENNPNDLQNKKDIAAASKKI